MSLSERFSKLKSQSIASGRVDRQISQNNSTKEKRNNQTQGKRGLKVNNVQGLAKNANLRGGKRPIKVGQATAKGGKRNKKNGKGKGKEGNIVGGNEKIAASQPDLDKDMDSYWFKAGKGPDPALASLDRDMDAYFLGKAAAVDVSTLPVSASAESVPMTV